MRQGDEQRLGSQYVLDERIGRGAMGTVWRGRDTDTGQPVAVKILAEELCEDPDVLARFVQERRVLLGIRHRNLVAVHDMVVERNRLALVMDLVPGGDLHRLLSTGGVLTPAQAAGLAAQMCAALQAVHEAGVVHRDLKPANVLLDLGGPRPVVRLADFGVARIADRSRITARTSIVGTPSYLAPELIRGREPVPASDVYALGITVYELLAGRPPFDGGTVLSVLHRHLEDSAARVEGIPDSLWAVIEACLRKDPEARPDAAAVGTMLRKALPGLIGLPAVAVPLSAEESGLAGQEHGETGSVVYAMPETFYGSGGGSGSGAGRSGGLAAGSAGGAGVRGQGAVGVPSVLPGAVPVAAPANVSAAGLMAVVGTGADTGAGTAADAGSDSDSDSAIAQASASQPAIQAPALDPVTAPTPTAGIIPTSPASRPARGNAMDPTEQIPVIRPDFRGYGPPPAQSANPVNPVDLADPVNPVNPANPIPANVQPSERAGNSVPASAYAPESEYADTQPVAQAAPHFPAAASAATAGSGAASPSAPMPAEPFIRPEPYGGSGPFVHDPSPARSGRRRRRTAVIAGSVTSVLLISGAVALAMSDNGSSSAPQPGHTGGPAALGLGDPGSSPALVTLGAGPGASTGSATATPDASASATPSATASGKGALPLPQPTTTAQSGTAAPTTAPVVNFALHRPVSVSSTLTTSTFAAANLTNGDFSPTTTADEGWSSKKDPAAASTEWVSVHLAETTAISDVNLYPRTYGGKTSCFPTAFTVATSTDGTHWTTVVTKTGYTPSGTGAQRFSFKKLDAGYIKVTATALTQDTYKDYYFQLQQLSVY